MQRRFVKFISIIQFLLGTEASELCCTKSSWWWTFYFKNLFILSNKNVLSCSLKKTSTFYSMCKHKPFIQRPIWILRSKIFRTFHAHEPRGNRAFATKAEIYFCFSTSRTSYIKPLLYNCKAQEKIVNASMSFLGIVY